MTRWLLLVVGAAALLAACLRMDENPTALRRGFGTGAGHASGSAPTTILPPLLPSDVGTVLLNPAAAHEELCTADMDHPNFPDDADTITKVFCQDKKPGGVMPTPKGLADLLKLLGLDFKDPNGKNGEGGNPAFAILGHSSALTARKVTTITPTAFIFTPPPADGSPITTAFIVVGFDPGEQFVEVASYDPTGKSVNFYAVFFDQACNATPGGCTTTDLLTPKLVTGWNNVRIYEDTTALGNTILDCHVCHQANNAADPILRMQEIAPPFTHWFSANTDGGRALLGDFHAAHGTNEDYGGIPAAMLDQSDPSKLAALVKQAGFGMQPNAFASAAIEAELKSSAPGQPLVNIPMGQSPTWKKLYDDAASGLFIAAPYHDVKVTDPTKLAVMTTAYQKWLTGAAPEVPELRDIFLDDGLRDMGFAPKLGLDGRGLIVQMCQECHHSKLDMMVTREKFLVDQLDQMSREEKNIAIDRLNTPITNRLAMPPALFRTITDDERQLMIETLKK